MKEKHVTELDTSTAKPVENARRLYLRVTLKLMLCFAVCVAAWIILSPLFKPHVPVNAKPVETVINMDVLAANSVDIIEWSDKPLIIARRSRQAETRLESTAVSQLQDPENAKSVQPEAARNAIRSAHAGWFLAIGIGTSTGCAVTFAGENSSGAVFTDACDRSQYDLAGRALRGSKAKKNLPVPHWWIEDNKIIVSTEPVR